MMSAKPMIFLCFLVAGIFGSRFSDQTSIANDSNDVDIESNLSLFYRNNSTAKDETNKISTIPNGAHLNDLMRGYLQLDLKGVFWGACPNRPGASNFNLLSFLGVWYVHSTFGGLSSLNHFQCQRTTFYLQQFNQLSVYYGVKLPLFFPMDFEIRADGIYDQSVKSRIMLKYTLPILNQTVSIPYWILATDHVNWAVTYNCMDYTFINLQTVVVLTRKRLFSHADPSDIKVLYSIKTALENAGFKSDEFYHTQQFAC